MRMSGRCREHHTHWRGCPPRCSTAGPAPPSPPVCRSRPRRRCGASCVGALHSTARLSHLSPATLQGAVRKPCPNAGRVRQAAPTLRVSQDAKTLLLLLLLLELLVVYLAGLRGVHLQAWREGASGSRGTLPSSMQPSCPPKTSGAEWRLQTLHPALAWPPGRRTPAQADGGGSNGRCGFETLHAACMRD